ncbi:MAG: ATP-binding protein [Prevotellaceae bacterium]|jgi:nicotinamide riboside kinase|nr:ATP-binding protein [Prevotellaceae bacterium]
MKKIVVLGPESVGKTTLCIELQKLLGAVFIPEFARTYVEGICRTYTYDDVELIAKQQVADFKKAVAEHSESEFLIMDTFLIVTKIWFLHVFSRCPAWLQSELEKSKIDLFLLLKPDIEWEDDPVRENPHIREYLYDWYKAELDALGANYAEIDGFGAIRTKRAMKAVRARFICQVSQRKDENEQQNK